MFQVERKNKNDMIYVSAAHVQAVTNKQFIFLTNFANYIRGINKCKINKYSGQVVSVSAICAVKCLIPTAIQRLLGT